MGAAVSNRDSLRRLEIAAPNAFGFVSGWRDLKPAIENRRTR